MTPDRARQLLEVQVNFGSGYNANSAKLVLSEVQKEHGQAVVDQLIREMNLEQVFGFEPGTHFENGLAIKN
jgi:nucleotidyltransferase/DNA polymerase involved in DNA repair